MAKTLTMKAAKEIAALALLPILTIEQAAKVMQMDKGSIFKEIHVTKRLPVKAERPMRVRRVDLDALFQRLDA